jgi:ABC-type Fe3+-citrate transport system substrate-binding protein
MKSRERVLEYLVTDYRVAGLTAGEALAGINPNMILLLSQEDQYFFRLHADEPCHEVARACNAGHVWHGNENKK